MLAQTPPQQSQAGKAAFEEEMAPCHPQDRVPGWAPLSGLSEFPQPDPALSSLPQVKEFDSISRLDQWLTTMLLRIKKSIQGDGEGDGDLK